MNKQQSLIHYRVAISVFRNWLDEGAISEEDITKLEALIADKYGLSKGSIYR